jgi:hypothetical protein
MDRRAIRILSLLSLLAGCAAEPEPPPATAAIAADRPLDGVAGDAAAIRTAALLEAALAQLPVDDLRRCVAEVAGVASGLAPPAHGSWLIVASALAADGPAFARRRDAAPELHPEPDDGWQDRVVFRTLLRPADRSVPGAACLSCIFEREDDRLSFRHGYALPRCDRAVPPERDLAVVIPLD